MQSTWIVRDDEVADGDLADEKLEQLHRLKHSPDGHHILIPQPNEDPKNPLNWSSARKWAVLIAISFAGVLPDFGSATGAVTLIPQGVDWNLDPNYVNRSQAGNVFMLGAGGLFAVVGCQVWGRQPVVFWMIALSVVFAVLCAAAPDFQTFFAARILNGFFSAPTQATGLLTIQDLFFFHEQVRKTNIWSFFFILSPYAGPVISAAILSANPENVKLWHWSFGFFTIMSFIALLGIVIFADETFYNRNIPQEQQPPVGSRFARLTGIGKPKNSSAAYSLKESSLRLLTTFLKPPVWLTCISFSLSFAWVVGINTTLPIFLVPRYGFGVRQIAYFYFTPVVAVVLAEIVGHYLNPFVQELYLKRHKGVWKPEARLLVNAFATPFLISGLVLLGYALERTYHYMLVSLGWGLFVFGIMISCTGFYQYLLDSYPSAAGEVSSWVNMFRVLGGFIISYEIVDFVGKHGAIYAFGVFAGITAISQCFVPFLYVFGPTLREKAGPVGYTIPTYTGRWIGQEKASSIVEQVKQEQKLQPEIVMHETIHKV